MQFVTNLTLDELNDLMAKHIKIKPFDASEYFEFPNSFKYLTDINGRAYTLLLFLCEKYYECYKNNQLFLLISVQECITKTKIKKNTFARSMQELIDTGKIVIRKKSNNRMAGNLLIFIPEYHPKKFALDIAEKFKRVIINTDDELFMLFDKTKRK